MGNLNEDGYLTATDEELVELLLQSKGPELPEPIPFERGSKGRLAHLWDIPENRQDANGTAHEQTLDIAAAGDEDVAFLLAAVREARTLVNFLDPVGVGARDLRECLLIQIYAQQGEAAIVLRRRQMSAADGIVKNGASDDENFGAMESVPVAESGSERADIFSIATHIVTNCLPLLQKKDMRELTRSCGRTAEEVNAAVEFIRTLDPRPGQRYNHSETRLIEPDVAFVKRDDVYIVVMNEEDMPTLRLNQGYRKMLQQKQTEKEVKEYVKERYKSAIQLLRNIEQRKNTIVRTCEVIVRRQTEFLEHGVNSLKPMMIKEVAEEIGVHPSTVSRAVAISMCIRRRACSSCASSSPKA